MSATNMKNRYCQIGAALMCGVIFLFWNVPGTRAQNIVSFETGSQVLYIVPEGVAYLQIETWGGGGRGGTRTSGNSAYGGGGGGAYARSVIPVTPGKTFYVTVGAGSNNNSNPGGDSYVSTYAQGTGEQNKAGAIVLAKGGSTVPNNSSTGALGGSALSSIGSFVFSGGNGADGQGSNGGGGGSAAGPWGNGTNGTGATGGISPIPSMGGSGGNGRTGTSGNGVAGGAPGGGGGGAYRASGSATGGNGGNGRVLITPIYQSLVVFTSTDAVIPWTPPEGVTKIQVETWGGGGKGGTRTSTNNRGAGGGGGGAYSRSVLNVSPNTTYYIQVGAGSSSISSGGDSWFSTSNSAAQAQVLAKGGQSVGNNTVDGALGGSSAMGQSIGEVRFAGGRGGSSSGNTSAAGGGGGSSASPSSNGNYTAATTTRVGGTISDGGSGGEGKATGSTGAGSPGQFPGGGGGGGYRTNTGTGNGGSGASGQVKITILQPDLGLTTTTGSLIPHIGSEVTLTLTVKNYSSFEATNVQITEVVPSGLTYLLHSSPSQGSVDLANSKWIVGNLAGDATATLSITFRIESSGSYTNLASVVCDEGDSDMSNNASSLTLQPQQVQTELRVSIEADSYAPEVGNAVTFTVYAANQGPFDASQVAVTHILPSGFQYQSHSGGGTFDPLSGIWQIGDLDKNEHQTLTISGLVLEDGNYGLSAQIEGAELDPIAANNHSSLSIFPDFAGVNVELDCEETTKDLSGFANEFDLDNRPPGSILTWHSDPIATGANRLPDISELEPGTYYLAYFDAVTNCYSQTTPVTLILDCADVGVQKSVSNTKPRVGQIVTYTITLSNAGPSEATSVVVIDQLPNGLINVQGISHDGVWDEDARTITWPNLELEKDAQISLTYQVKIAPLGPDVYFENYA